MTTKVREFFSAQKYSGANATSVAAVLREGKDLHYFESPHRMIPAAAYMLNDKKYKNKDIYTNLAANNWIRQYTSKSVRPAGNYVDRKKRNIGEKEVTPKKLTGLATPPLLKYRDVAAPLEGGLYEAAKATIDRKVIPDRSKVSALEKALRYYMLAAYSLLAIGKELGFKGLGNYVAALLVSDDGKIISAGVNTGWYRHAEVTMLIDYFSKNPGVDKYPQKSVVFSTLTPCEQCTKYLETAKPAETVIYFGQFDTGESGKAGQRLGPSLSSKTKPPRGREKEKVEAEEQVEEDESSGVGVKIERTAITKTKLASKLGSCIDSGKSNIAKQLTQSDEAMKTMHGAADALIHKVGKERGDSNEARIKSKVLQHLTAWLISAEMRT